MIGTTVSHYVVVGKLGEGGMAVVYEGQDTRLPRRVALKFLHENLKGNPMSLARFKREAAALSQLNHPNICTIYEVDEFHGQPFLAMERLEGRTLRSRLTEGHLEAAELVDVAIQIVQALQAAHDKGIVHRDIKPSNIFITAHGVKVLDFGLAKPLEPTDTHDLDDLTADGRPVGTASYMSPEQIQQDALDPRSDLFSLGVVLFEMATGIAPFKGETVNETINNVLEKDPPSIADLAPHQSRELDAVIKRLLARNPRERYQSAWALLTALQWLAARIASPRIETATGPTPPPDTTIVPSQPVTLLSPSPSQHSSSDAHVVATLIKRHRAGVAVALVTLAMALSAAYCVVTRYFQIDSTFQNAQLVQLTTSGNAEQPAISPDGKYVAYIQRSGNDWSIWIRQTPLRRGNFRDVFVTGS